MNLAEFGDWGLAEKSVANPGVGTYKGQCVSLIQQYLYRVFGVSYKPRGNAKDWERNPGYALWLVYNLKICTGMAMQSLFPSAKGTHGRCRPCRTRLCTVIRLPCTPDDFCKRQFFCALPLAWPCLLSIV